MLRLRFRSGDAKQIRVVFAMAPTDGPLAGFTLDGFSIIEQRGALKCLLPNYLAVTPPFHDHGTKLQLQWDLTRQYCDAADANHYDLNGVVHEDAVKESDAGEIVVGETDLFRVRCTAGILRGLDVFGFQVTPWADAPLRLPKGITGTKDATERLRKDALDAYDAALPF